MTQHSADAAATGSSQLTVSVATRVLREVCRPVGLDPAGAELVRIGSNAVFRLREPVIVRIAASADALGEVDKQVHVARWLASVDYPATRALDVEQPVLAAGRVASFWVSAAESERYAPLDDVARLLRRLHGLRPPAGLVLPAYDPFAAVEARLHRLDGVAAEDGEYLRQRLIADRERYAQLRFELPRGVIHGDANVGNVILDRDGGPVLIDLDGFSLGPREWDLIQTALFTDRFGWHTPEEYRRFVAVYGYDIMKWSGYPVLADIRELLMTSWMASKAGVDAKYAAETHKRVTAMRTGAARRDWAPY